VLGSSDGACLASFGHPHARRLNGYVRWLATVDPILIYRPVRAAQIPLA
jgi:hypothetical protein